jgi:hypothetical protein
MKKIDLLPEDFFFPLFLEVGFTLNPLAVHPLYELEISKSTIMLCKNADINVTSRKYGEELFRKLTEILTYEYNSFMIYQLENIVDKREWLKNFIILISANKDLFISRCGSENYAFLFQITTAHLSAFNTDMLTLLIHSCEECNHRVLNNIKQDIVLIKHLDGPEKKYFCFKLQSDLRQFANYKDLRFDRSAWENLKDESEMINIENQLLLELNEAVEKKGLGSLDGLKPIIAKCSTEFCAKIFSEFIRNCRDEKGMHVFEINNLNLSKWMPVLFSFVNAKKISSSTFRDKLPSKSKN